MAREPFGEGSSNERRAKEQFNRGQEIAKKEKPEKFDPIISGVKTRKSGLGRKLSEIFIANDPVTVSDYVFNKIFVPSVQDLMLDMVWGGLSMLFREGEIRAPKRGNRSSYYHDSYSDRNASKTGSEGYSRGSERLSGTRSIDELVFYDLADAEDVRDKRGDMIEEYGNISIGDVLDLCDIEHSFTDNDWGWTDLSKVKIERLGRGRYTLYFPKARRL